MNTLSAIFGFGTWIALITLGSLWIRDAFQVVKYGLEDDDICNEDED